MGTRTQCPKGCSIILTSTLLREHKRPDPRTGFGDRQEPCAQNPNWDRIAEGGGWPRSPP